jgi:hypothetical protein
LASDVQVELDDFLGNEQQLILSHQFFRPFPMLLAFLGGSLVIDTQPQPRREAGNQPGTGRIADVICKILDVTKDRSCTADCGMSGCFFQ